MGHAGMGGFSPQQKVEGTPVRRSIGQDTLGNNGNKKPANGVKAIQKTFKQWPQ